MHIVGVVAEYNPFHAGHQYHIRKAKEETKTEGVVAVMSGNFVQRGEPAVFDKWTRAFHAINSGVDLVIELPTLYALSSAEHFAKGAIETLLATGVVDTLSFGSECGDLQALRKAAQILEEEPDTFKTALKENLKKGNPYASAREKALNSIDEEAGKLLSGPNNILAISYLRAAGNRMEAHTVKRMGNSYLDTVPNGEFASALAIRQMLANGENIQAFVPYETEGLEPVFGSGYAQLLQYALRTTDFSSFESIPSDVKKRITACKMGVAWDKVKTRNISMASVKRAMLHILLQNDLSPALPPAYIRILGFTPKGETILKAMKQKAQLPVITRPAAYKENSPLWELDKRATDIYFIPRGTMEEDMKRPPVKAGF